MKASFYELFDSGAAHRAEAAENVKFKTLRRLEQTQAPRRSVRPLRRVLIAAVLVIALVGGAFAAPAIVNALTGMNVRQAGESAVLQWEDGILAREGYLEIAPEVLVNEDAPDSIETYYIPMFCTNWEKTPLFYSTAQAPTMQRDACFAWVQPETGNRVELRQFPLKGYTADHCFDTIPLGFGNDYARGMKQLGSVQAQCISVPPSGADGAGDPGLQKLYWSDGDYLFTLEVNYDMPDETLDAILSSLTPVEDFRPYVRMERAEPANLEIQPVQTALFPAAVPDGWVLAANSGRQTDSTWSWIWSYADRSGLELLQETEPTSCDCERLDWLGSMEDYRSYETTVGDWRVTVFESDFKAALLWKTETTYVVLRSSGPDRLSAEALLQIAESLQPLQ